MKIFTHLLPLLFLISRAYSFFCSAYCAPNQCSGIAKTQCTGCDAPFVPSSGSCNLDTVTTSYFLAADSSNITVSPSATGSCSVYTFTGPQDSNVAYTLTHTGPISIQHMKIRLILWIIMYDEWKPQTDYIQSKLVSSGELYQMNISLHQTQQNLCATSKNQWFMKSDYIFTHSDTTNPVVFTITAQHTGGILKWGIKDYIILASGCHPYCLACTDLLATTCSSCKTGYKLSGTTCAATCLTQYGSTSNSTLCVLCDLKCSVCFDTSSNCSVCTTSGANQAFLLGTQCINPCPSGYAVDTVNHKCLQCTNSACISCSPTNLSYCYSCVNTSYWYSFNCYNPCPSLTYVSGLNCTDCDISCSVCTGTPTPCTQCRTGYKLSGTTCATSCLTQYGSTSNTSLCVLCDLKCTTCYDTSTNCSACTTSGTNEAFLLGTQCINPCPSGYAVDTVNHKCLQCTNSACISCSPTNLSYCYSCNNSTYWYLFDCYNPCPALTYLSGTNCTDCDISCSVCTGTPTPCTQCRTGYKLSGTTCAVTCLTQYGSTSNTSICVLCDLKCTTCYDTSTNCSACTTNGTNEAFLLGTQCINPCPSGYAVDTVNHKCLQCTNSACISCSPTNLSYCYSCSNTTYWYSFNCYNPCPALTYLSGTNCTDCDISCSVCTGTPTPCTQCRTGYKLSGTTCATNCLTQYGPTSNTSLCVLCDLNCTMCYQTATNCSACTTSGANEAFLLGTQCINPCPAGYLADIVTHHCLLCFNPACLTCNNSDHSQCFVCNSTTFLLNYDCVNSCPAGYYPSGQVCNPCDISCLICSGSPSPCSTCNTSYYFLTNVCYSTCPAGYFAHVPTQNCLDCSIYCVTATLTLTLVSKKQLHIDIAFNHPIDFSTFPYQTFQSINESDISVTLSQFTITYSITSDRSYRIVLQPISDTFTMTDVLFTVDINDNATIYYSQDGYQFSPTIYDLTKDIIWNIPVVIDNTTWQLKTLEDINNQINNFFNQKWVQEIKKAGVFALLFPGAQLCSTIILHNSTPPVNMYEGARFWGSFIYFEVPQWQKDGSGLKCFFNQLMTSLFSKSTQRILANSQGVDWRFERTGHTGYFIFDAYIPLILVVLSWMPILILNRFPSNKPKYRKYKSFFYTSLHRIHQICMFYLLIAVSLQWTYFSSHTATSYKYISLGFSIAFVIYCLIYEIHAFYQIIPYTHTDIGSNKYNFYVERYSYFLRDLRFEEYGVYTRWDCSHFLRPYNYQILSFFRLALILASLPVFQSIAYGCISCLVVFQFLQIIRFLLSWPYFSNWRNYYKLCLQLCLLVIFILYLVADLQYRNNSSLLTVDWMASYKMVGWAGFIALFIYNVMYFFYFCIDVVVGCKYTNRQRMEHARNCYYREMLEEYETYQEITNPTMKQSEAQSFFGSIAKKNGYMSLLNSIHKAEPAIELGTNMNQKQTIQMIAHRGNLCKHDYEKFWVVKVKIEEYEIRQLESTKYSISYCKVKDLYMHLHPDLNRKYNILMPERRTKQVKITPIQNQFYFNLVENIYKHYKTEDTEVVIVKTYLKIDQNLYKPGEKIPIRREDMSQQIQMKEHSGYSEREKLLAILRGFPVPDELLLLL